MTQGMMGLLRTIGGNSRGTAAIEYGLIAALIAVACIGSLTKLSKQVNKQLKTTTKVMKKIK